MTSRLKRKLDEAGIDYTSRKANENFCLIGTPLPPLEKTKDAGEFVPLWKQDVRDEQGRRRLHGAFTGGWSAGYYNTVGSKEGWTPSTFVSSRSDRAKAKAAKPEDFMDEEDLEEMRDGKQLASKIEQVDLSDIFGGQKPSEGDDEEASRDPISEALRRAMHAPAEKSVGVQLLMKMGWRPGQGVGPRVSFEERKAQDAEAIDPTTGARLLGDALNIPDDDPEARKHTYPRRDTPVLRVKRKDNFHGLGYTPGLSLNEQLGDGGRGNQGPNLAGGFGLGALNDADEDDLDVYDQTLTSKRLQKSVAYDHAMDDDTIAIGRKGEQRSANSKPPATSGSQYFRDGTRVVPGFVVSNEPVQQDASFPWPEVPPGWKPDPRRVWAKEPDKENLKIPSKTGPIPHHQWKTAGLTAGQRGAALGETPLSAPQRSIFDYISSKDKERLERAAQSASAGAPPSEPPQSTARLEPHIAQAALKGFQPFTTDPAKQARYTAFLLSQAAQDGSAPSLKALPGQAPHEFRKELEDYAKAASLFKPITGAIASRFTTAAVVEREPEVREGLHQPTPGLSSVAREIELREQEEKRKREEQLNPKVHAAKMGMYGAMTREVTTWVPARLLCKRFGVKEPEVTLPTGAEQDSGTAATSSGLSYTPSAAEKELMASFGGAPEAGSSEAVGGSGSGGRPRNIEQIGFGDDESQGQDILTSQRPSMDVFKAIFASDEEDSDDEEELAELAPGELTTILPGSAAEDDKPKFTPATVILEDKPFDPEAFKATFKKKSKEKERDSDVKDKKERKEKKKKEKKGGLVSFQLDEEGGGEEGREVKQPKDRPKKKTKRENEPADDGDVKMVVDSRHELNGTTTASVQASLPIAEHAATVTPQVSSTDTTQEPKLRGRKRAVDFLDE